VQVSAAASVLAIAVVLIATLAASLLGGSTAASRSQA
jgi:hypothetical protein